MSGTAHVIGPVDVPLLDETIPAMFDAVVAAHPDRDALVAPFQDVRLSYRQLAEQVDRVACGLLALGVDPGDRVGMWSPNNVQWVYLQFAAASVGAILVNLNPAYRTEELVYAVAQSGCRVVVAARAFKTSDYMAMIADARQQLPDLEHVVFLDTPDWDDMVAAGESVGPAELESRRSSLSAHDPVNIQYTSGTTGPPKGATLSHHNLVNNGYFVGEGFRYTELDRVCIPVPFYHTFGMVIGNLACVTHGAAIVIPSDSFDVLATLRTIQDESCTSVLGVPTMFISVLANPAFDDFDLSTLRTGMMAGAPCPTEVMKRCINEMHMPEITIGYGMTETSPVSTQTSADDPIDRRVETVGRVHPHVELKIVDVDSGVTVDLGEPGELCTRGYSVMLGYWDDPQRTAEAVDPDGWMHSGDLATLDSDGYVRIVGRIKDLIIRGGENISPREIEEFLHTMPGVVDAHVIGVPDRVYGEELMAWVRVSAGVTLTRDDVVAFSTGRIAHFKIPRYLHVTEDFPMTVTGKIQKYKMRELSIDLLDATTVTT
jgi:fatty-acyl-CoA synthase